MEDVDLELRAGQVKSSEHDRREQEYEERCFVGIDVAKESGNFGRWGQRNIRNTVG